MAHPNNPTVLEQLQALIKSGQKDNILLACELADSQGIGEEVLLDPWT